MTRDHNGSGAVLTMGGCYALNTFTDNFYKQAAILIASAASLSGIQSLATVLYSLPFILFSAWAGWLADRLPKRNIVVAAKLVELCAMLAGGWMLLHANWAGILVVMFCMGAQATAFSPALNGSIPEHFPAERVPRVNSLIKLASTAAVLAGMALAGIFLDLRPGLLPSFGLDGQAYGRALAWGLCLIVAIAGVALALGIRRHPPAIARGAAGPAFPWTGPLDSCRHALECRGDARLFLILTAEAWFYGIAVVAVICVANLATYLGYSNTLASLLSACLMIGIAVGSLLAGRFSADIWTRLLTPACAGLGLFLLLLTLAPALPANAETLAPRGIAEEIDARSLWMFAMLFCAGICGGLYLIPVSSYIQIRPAATEKGKVLGVSNFLTFAAMTAFGAVFALVSLLPPHVVFGVYGASCLGFALWLTRSIPVALRQEDSSDDVSAGAVFAGEGSRNSASGDAPGGRPGGFPGAPHGNLAGNLAEQAGGPLALLLRFLLSLRYRVNATGLERLAPQAPSAEGRPGILFLPNHPALVDPALVYSRLAGLRPRPLADERQARALGPVARMLHMVTIPDPLKDGGSAAEGVREGIERIIAALKAGDNVLLYPSGRLYRSAREDVGANSAAARILAEMPDLRVVLVRTTGLWGSVFGYARGKAPNLTRELRRGLLTILANGIFFTPRRQVRMEFVEPADLPRDGGKMRLNAYLNEFYSHAERLPTAVPRYWWRGGAPVPLPVIAKIGGKDAARDLPGEMVEEIYALLRRTADLPADHPLSPEMSLSADLGLDSLGLMEIATGLETEYGHPIPNLEPLVLVNDCLLAASGRLESPDTGDARPVPPAWFALDQDPAAATELRVAADARTTLDAFVRLARAEPSRPLLAERGGVKTRRQILTGMLALSRRFAALPGERLGIMLPAVPAATVVWLAALHAGKVPVMINWTVGQANLRHCLRLAGVERIVTATRLLEQLRRTGDPFAGLPVEWVAVDVVGASLGLAEKVRAAALAFGHCLGLTPVKTAQTPETAAILFTSGSEAAPKAVPLSHANVMTNAADVIHSLRLPRNSRILSMLPPFHSFGLMVGLVLPSVCGVAVACHPNPTESAPLVFLTREYKLTVLGATPTFLDAMLGRIRGDEMASLRYAFTGAEKCPERVRAAFARLCPNAALCEGYGITECSPVVSVNPPDDATPGSIGRPLAHVETALVLETENGMKPAAPGETAMLLTRGPSIFAGYLTGPSDMPAPADPFVEYDGRRWYRTGDLVRADKAGRLYFMGRLKRFVKIGGEMISLPQMEEVLAQALAGRADLPEGGAPFMAVEAAPGSEEAGRAELLAFTPLDLQAREINALLRSGGLSPLYAVRRVVRLPVIPLLGTGKTDYRALKRMVQ